MSINNIEELCKELLELKRQSTDIAKRISRLEDVLSDEIATYEMLAYEEFDDEGFCDVSGSQSSRSSIKPTWSTSASARAEMSKAEEVEYTGIHAAEIADLGFSTRVCNIFERNCIYQLGDLLDTTESELKEMRYLGAACLKEIKDVLLGMGCTLKKESRYYRRRS